MQTVKPGEQAGGGVWRVQCFKVFLVSLFKFSSDIKVVIGS